MAYTLVIVGLVIAGFGIWGVARPRQLMATVVAWEPATRQRVAIGMRVVMGVVFLLAAPETRHPTAVAVLGGIALFAAVVLALMGAARLEAMVRWWFEQTEAFIRLWCLAAICFGAFLVQTAL